MSPDSWWAADSHSLIGFTNEVSGANKHLRHPTPVTWGTASIHSNLSLSLSCTKALQPWVRSRSSLSHSSDHLSCLCRPTVSFVATVEHFSRKRKRLLSKNPLRGRGETLTFTALADSTTWLSHVSPLDITHDIILQTRASKSLDAGVWLGQSMRLTKGDYLVSCMLQSLSLLLLPTSTSTLTTFGVCATTEILQKI